MDFNDFINFVYLLKLLYDTDEYKFNNIVSSEELTITDYDIFYDYFYSTVFENEKHNYYEQKELDLIVFSDSIIDEFYKLAGEYGELKGVTEEDNPYFNEAENKMCENFDFSYSLSWVLKGYSKPKRKFHSRFALFIDQNEYVDVCGIAIGLLNMYRFFRDKRNELAELLYTKETVAA